MLNIELPDDLAIPLLGIYPREMKGYIYTETCTWMFIALFTIAKNMETTQISINWWMDKQNSIQKMEYYSSIKRNQVLIHATVWINLENIMLSEGQTQKVIYFMILFMWNVQKWEIHRDSKISSCQRLRGLGSGGWGGGWPLMGTGLLSSGTEVFWN